VAQPYSTIEGLGSGPELWLRFKGASAGAITNEGSGSSDTMSEHGPGTSAGLTYQYDTNPRGETNSGLKCTSGQILGVRINNQSYLTNKGTWMTLFKSLNAGASQGRWMAGFWSGTDDEYVAIRTAAGEVELHQQNSGTDDQFWTTSGAPDLLDTNPHSVAITMASTPTIYVDGAVQTVVETDDPQVPDNHWWDNFSEDHSIFTRGNVHGTDHSDWVMYEYLCWDEVLSAANISTAHVILTTIDPFESKTIRRTNRRLFYAH